MIAATNRVEGGREPASSTLDRGLFMSRQSAPLELRRDQSEEPLGEGAYCVRYSETESSGTVE
jgi:hypothetical protein